MPASPPSLRGSLHPPRKPRRYRGLQTPGQTFDPGAPRSRVPKQLDLEPRMEFKGKNRGLTPESDESHLPRRVPNLSPYRDKGLEESIEQRDRRQGYRRL